MPLNVFQSDLTYSAPGIRRDVNNVEWCVHVLYVYVNTTPGEIKPFDRGQRSYGVFIVIQELQTYFGERRGAAGREGWGLGNKVRR